MRSFRIIFVLCVVLLSCEGNGKLPPIIYPKGGYNYPANLDGADTSYFSYPLKDSVGVKRAFYDSYYSPYWSQAYNEPNLSLRYMGKDIFRLVWGSSWGHETIITLMETEIVIKERIDGSPYPLYDSLLLTPIERQHYELLNFNFPLNTKSKRIDSITKKYPQLPDPAYFRYLLEKSGRPDTSFKFSLRKKSISRKQYLSIVEKINNSGYWNLPPGIDCSAGVADGSGFNLEANTAQQYNTVGAGDCPGDTSSFRKACQDLIKIAGLEKEIDLIWGDDD